LWIAGATDARRTGILPWSSWRIMSVAVGCSECGSPVYPEDRFCGACGAPQSVASADVAVSTSSADHAARLLAELRALTAGEYEIRGEIGRGGMAVVYLAYDLRLNRKVAIKAMLPDLAFRDGMEERFKREARTAARLDHPNIVVIYSVRDSGVPLFFVMKYVDGAPLDAVLHAHGPLPIPVVQGLLLQLCAALQHAHDDGVVHRDVKPANILIDMRGTVQVTDFGIAKAVDSSNLTRTGMTIGTPTYMCPEQCLCKPQTPASDQYSLGVVAYELLTGVPPFAGSAVEIQWAHVREMPPWVSTLRPDCPGSLATAIMRMLAKDPSERWPTLRHALPLIAAGLAPEADGGRPELSELVRASASARPAYAITPPSPVPRQASPRGTPSPPPVVRGDGPREPVARVDVEPNVIAVTEHTSVQLTVRAYTAKGREIVDPVVTFRCADPGFATIDADGLLRGVTPGQTTAAVSVADASASVIITVERAFTATLGVVPAPARSRRPLLIGVAAALVVVTGAAALFATHKPKEQVLAAAPSAPTPTQTTSPGTVAPKPVALPPKAVPNVPPVIPADTVVATLELTDPSPLALDVGETRSLIARVLNKSGELLPTVPVRWESSTPSVAAVDVDGVLTAAGVGRTLVTARVGQRKRVVTVDVKEAVPVRVSVSIARDSVQVGESVPASAQVFDRHNAPFAQGVAWRSLNENVATVDEGGVVHALGAGRATVVATAGKLADSVSIVVLGAAQRASEVPAAPTPASPSAPAAPTAADAQAIADTVVTMIERRVVRLDQLIQGDTVAGPKFRRFLDTNEPSAKLSAAPNAGEVRSGAVRVAFGVVLEWEAGTTHRERTANLETVVESVKGGWAIREIRFPGGFTP
jgi:serine/threonine-protein kinase